MKMLKDITHTPSEKLYLNLFQTKVTCWKHRETVNSLTENKLDLSFYSASCAKSLSSYSGLNRVSYIDLGFSVFAQVNTVVIF
jgi:hypothetical protein